MSTYLPARTGWHLGFQSVSSLDSRALGFPLLESLLVLKWPVHLVSFPSLLGIVVFACFCVMRVCPGGVCWLQEWPRLLWLSLLNLFQWLASGFHLIYCHLRPLPLWLGSFRRCLMVTVRPGFLWADRTHFITFSFLNLSWRLFVYTGGHQVILGSSLGQMFGGWTNSCILLED